MAEWSDMINARLSMFPDTIHLQGQYGTEAAQPPRLLILGVESQFSLPCTTEMCFSLTEN